MTNEEAIRTLKANYPDVCFGQLREAVDMAINALTAQADIPIVDTPTVDTPNCDDTISRQDAIRVASGYCHPANIAKELAKLPSAQAEPSQVARDIATIIENEKDMRVIAAQPDLDDVYAHAETEAEARFHAEIVRCKDCNHWSRESICDGFCSEDCMRHDEDFYCGYAERRTDERSD